VLRACCTLSSNGVSGDGERKGRNEMTDFVPSVSAGTPTVFSQVVDGSGHLIFLADVGGEE